MKRVLGLFAVLAIVGAVPMLHHSFAAPGGCVSMCADPSVLLVRPNGIVFMVGQVECVEADEVAEEQAEGGVLTSQVNVRADGATCCFSVLPDGTIRPGRVD